MIIEYVRNHSEVLFKWIFRRNKLCHSIIHIDKHSDLGSGDEKISCGSYLMYYFEKNNLVKEIVWLYPTYLNTLKSDKIISREIQTIFSYIKKKYANSLITYGLNKVKIEFYIKNIKKELIICSSLKKSFFKNKDCLLDVDIDMDYFFYVDNSGRVKLYKQGLKNVYRMLKLLSKECMLTISSSIDGGYIPFHGLYFTKIFINNIKRITKQEKTNGSPHLEKCVKNKYEKALKFEKLIIQNKISEAKKIYSYLIDKEKPDCDELRSIGNSLFFWTEGFNNKSLKAALAMYEIDRKNPYYISRLIMIYNIKKDYNLGALYSKELAKLYGYYNIDTFKSFAKIVKNEPYKSTDNILNKFWNEFKQEIEEFYEEMLYE